MMAPASSSPIRLHNDTLPPNRAIAADALAAMPPPLAMCSSARSFVGVGGNSEIL